MRPHVEFVDIKDLIWHMAEFPHASGDAEQQNLSYDEEDGSASLRVRLGLGLSSSSPAEEDESLVA